MSKSDGEEVTATTKLYQSNDNISNMGFCLVRIYDTKEGDKTLVNVKVQGEELTRVLDASNEEDFTTQFKLKRGTKEFAKTVASRLKIVAKDHSSEKDDGDLMLDIDWTGIRRIQIEAQKRAAKLEETRKQDEKRRKEREEKAAAEKAAEEKRKAEEARKQREEEKRRIEAEEFKRKQEQERKYKALTDTISGAMLNGGAVTDVSKLKKKAGASGDATEEHEEDESELQSGMSSMRMNVSKVWSEEHGDFYYLNEDDNELTWRHPGIQSNWEKLWSKDDKRFYYLNKRTQETTWYAPWSDKYTRSLGADGQSFIYTHKETGETREDEPYY